MKSLYGILVFAFLLPFNAVAGFEKHFGEYTVVSSSVSSGGKGCDLTDAEISRKMMNGVSVIILSAKSASSAENCSARFVGGLSVQGMPQMNCEESEHKIRCVLESQITETDATVSADGILSLQTTYTGANARTTNWVLRRK